MAATAQFCIFGVNSSEERENPLPHLSPCYNSPEGTDIMSKPSILACGSPFYIIQIRLRSINIMDYSTTSVLGASILAAVLYARTLDDDDSEDDDALQVAADEIKDRVSAEVRDKTSRRKRKRYDDENEDEREGEGPTKRRWIPWDREGAYECVKRDYTGSDAIVPLFHDRQFERVFRITRPLFEWLCCELASYDRWWTVRYDCTKRRSIMPVVKLLAALKLLCYGISFSGFQDYFQMGESTARLCVRKFSRALVLNNNINSLYLRKMNKSDARRVEEMHHEVHGIHGMLGSLDVNQIRWGNCPTEQKGQHVGKSSVPTLGLEAVADHNLWFWHWCFGWPGSMNDINIWDRSTLLASFLDGSFSELDFEFTVNGEVFNKLFFLVDGIYPRLARFLKTISVALTKIDRLLARWQEGKRKDVERAFGVWEKKFHSMVYPMQLFEVEDMYYVVGGCICLHNMMVAERIKRDEEESDNFYETVASKDPTHVGYIPEEVVVDPAVEAIAEEDSMFEDCADTLDLDNDVVDLDLQERLRRAKSLPLRLRYAQWRWGQLTDVEEHARLQNAVKNELWRQKYGDDADGNELASFNPLE